MSIAENMEPKSNK